ncbi:MAG: type VII secretion integral membrane protein EccD [Gordonia sp. (in: high G+C Gram-positive bacteria)]
MTDTEPELVRISILGGATQVDVALPAAAPIAALMPAVLDYLRVPDPPTDAQAPHTTLPRWTLAGVGGPPMPPDRSLADCGVHDGDLLVVHQNLPAAPGALVDDVVDGLAHLVGRNSASWSADAARRVGYGATLLGMSTAVISGLLAAHTDAGARTVVLATAAPLAVLLIVAALASARLGGRPQTVATLSASASLLALLAGSLAPQLFSPAATAPDWPASMIGGGVCALTAALVVHRGTGVAHRAHAAAATAAAMLAGAGLVATTGTDGLTSARDWSGLGAVVAVSGILIIALAARIAIAASRLPLPPVPSTPPSLDPDDYPDTAQVDGVGAVRSGDDQLGAIAALALVDLDVLERRARIAADYLTGIIAGATATTVAAASLCALASGGQTKSLLLCTVVAAALIARGRTHVDAVQSAILIGGGAIVAAATVVGTGSWSTAFAGGLGIACAALLVGTTAPSWETTPLQRRAAEVLEYATLVAAVPLVLWVLDVYRTVREI